MEQNIRENYLRKLLFIMCLLSQILPLGYFLYVAGRYHRKEVLPVAVIGGVLALASDYILFRKVLKNMDETHMREKFQTVQYRKELQEKYIRDMEKNREKTEHFRERLLEQLNEMKDKVEKQDKKEIEKSVDAFQQMLEDGKSEYFCEHMVLNMILTDKKRCAEEQRIFFRASAGVSWNLPVQSADLCSIVGNLLDNAIEACRYVGDGMKKEISVKCGMKDSHFIVKVENTYDPSVLQYGSEGYKSVKRGGKAYGLGMKIIERIVRKYDGELITEQKGGYFTSIVYLNCSVREGENSHVG